MSTMLSLYNKKVLGKKYGILNGEPFPAPLLMSAIQFTAQYLLARLAHASGCKRTAPTGRPPSSFLPSLAYYNYILLLV
jgi:hypothetical protein